MKSRMIKLMLSIFSTSLAAISLTASTFAYVLINNKVVVPDFDFNIKGQEGLEISLDNLNWSKDIIADSIKNKIYEDNKDYYELNHIDSFDGIKFGCASIKQKLDESTNEYIIDKDSNNSIKFIRDKVVTSRNNQNITIYEHKEVETVANTDQGFIKFDLYLKAKSTYSEKNNFKLKVSNDTDVTSSLVDVQISNSLKTKDMDDSSIYKVYNANDIVNVDISNAVRVGIYNAVEDENGEFKYDKFNIYEKSNEYDLGSVALESHKGFEDKNDPNTNAMYTYYNNYFVNYPFTKAASDGEAFKTKTKEELLNTEFGTFKYMENDYNVIKLEIYIWLEGWDADYFIGIPESTTIRVDLGFEIEKI